MKTYLFYAVCLLVFCKGMAQEKDYADVTSTIDGTIDALYNVISGEKGEERDWDLMRYIYHPNGRLVATRQNPDGTAGAVFLTPEGYIESSGRWLFENGFFEEEIHREVAVFGNIAQVFSTYQCFKSKSDTEPFMRGINSIQLINQGNRWRVVNIFWLQETEDNPIPQVYLPKQQ